MAKQDIIDELNSLGVNETGSTVEGVEKLTGAETVPQLTAILETAKEAVAKNGTQPDSNGDGDNGDKKDADENENSSQQPNAPVEQSQSTTTARKDKDFGDSVDVLSGKNFIRYYSFEIHGENFLELAKELIGKPEYATRNYEIKPSSETPRLEVRYREKEDAEKHPDEQSPDAPMLDKTRRFEDRDEAIAFSVQKHGSIVILTK